MTPACYGSPVSVSAASPSCCVCPRRVGCVTTAAQLVAAMPDTPITQRERQLLSVTHQAFARGSHAGDAGQSSVQVMASSRGIKRIALTAAEQKLVDALPDRVGTAVKRLLERGWFQHARNELAAGRNPAPKGWQRVLCAQILAGDASRATLQQAFVEQLGMSPASAKVQASTGLAIFAAGRVIVEAQGSVRLRAN